MTDNINISERSSVSDRRWKDFIPLSILIAGLLIAGAVIYVNKGGNFGGPATVNPSVSPTPTVSPSPEYENLNDFAKCLTEKGVKFYGASWCGHCANQKAMFGDSMKYVNYIECWDDETNKLNDTCTAAKIEAFPAWDFPGGERQMGEMPLEQLSELSGCPLTK